MKQKLIYVLLLTLILTGCVQRAAPAADPMPDSLETAAETQLVENSLVTNPEEITLQENTMTHISVTVGTKSFSIVLYNNTAAAAFAALLPMRIEMKELNRNEKYHYLWDGLPTDSKVPDRIQAGDLMLFGSDCIVLFYEDLSTSYSYTPLGYMENVEGLQDALGNGDVTVTFEILK